MPEFTRRDFLKLSTNTLLTASGLLGLGALFRFFEYQTEPPPQTQFDLGPSSNYPINSRTLLPKIPALLLHTDSGFSVLSLVCTHLGCTVESTDNGFTCPCHGSKYDSQGNVLNGPAKKQLNALRIEITSDGNLILHTD
jgi:Rieske Fe-S protein